MRLADVLRAIYTVCLLGGTSTHVLTLYRHGLSWDYGGVPPASALFWTSLTGVDPLVILLLFMRRTVGVVATVVLMVADVSHNLWILDRFSPPLPDGVAKSWPVQCQIAFLLFVLATAPLAWGRKPSSHPEGEENADSAQDAVLVVRGRSVIGRPPHSGGGERR